MTDQNRIRNISIVLFFLALLMLAVHMESIVRFNRQEMQVHGNVSSGGLSMEIDARQDSTSSWLKRSFPMAEDLTVDLHGQTVDGMLQNRSGDSVQDWELRVNIAGDCYVNQAWNGEVEIHQFTGTDREKVQRMNLQNYNLDDVTFEYFYDGDLLIPLQKGDYIIYYPNDRFKEMPVSSGDDVKIGMIFYYLDQLDLSDYDLRFHYHRSFTQGITFYMFVILAGLWLLSVITMVVVTLTYRRARKEMELRKSGIFSLSDIYDVIYIINLPTGELTPVSISEQFERNHPKDRNAKEFLNAVIMEEADEKYRDMMLEFIDTDTLAERLKDRNSIVSEFFSNRYGWCSVRFFAMDRVEGKPLENVVFAVQDIDEEKKELEAITDRIARAEEVSHSRSAFMENLARDFQQPLQELLARIGQIRPDSPADSISEHARDAHSIASRLLAMTEGLVDSYEIQSGRRQMAAEAYSLRQLLISMLKTVLPAAEQYHVSVALDAAETLPDHLRGDSRLLERVLLNLASGLLPAAADGRMQLSVYGKAVDDRIHLLFSVRVFSGPDPDGSRAADSGTDAGLSGLTLDAASALLTVMGSSLRQVPDPPDRKEYYFETEQQILDDSPLGKISAEDAAE